MAPPHRAVDAVRAHDQVCIATVVVLEFRLEAKLDPELGRPALKDAKERAPGDAGLERQTIRQPRRAPRQG